MVKPASTQAIEDGTKTSWQEWCVYLDASNAAALDHSAIVKKAREFRPISGWWAQAVAVAYEQHIGRRKPGQTSNGLFSASVSRTIDGDLERLHRTWCDYASGLSKIDGLAFSQPPTTSVTPKRLYWRCKFEDASKAAVSMEMKDNGKVLVVVEHNKLSREAQIIERKQSWAGVFAQSFNLKTPTK